MSGSVTLDKSPYEILGVGPEVTPEQLEIAYYQSLSRAAAVHAAGAFDAGASHAAGNPLQGPLVDLVEWAYRQIRESSVLAVTCADGIVSAELLPGVDPFEPPSSPALESAPRIVKRDEPSAQANVVTMFRRPGATAGVEGVEDGPLMVLSSGEGEGTAGASRLAAAVTPAAATTLAQTPPPMAVPAAHISCGEPEFSEPDGLQALMEMPQIPAPVPGLALVDDEEQVIEQVVGEAVSGRGPRPKTIRSVIGEGEKRVVETQAQASLTSQGRSKISKIFKSYQDPCGPMLAEVRVSLGVTLAELSSRTKVSERHLAALERDDFGQLPAAVYYRGFVDSYLRYLGIVEPGLVSALVSRYQERRR